MNQYELTAKYLQLKSFLSEISNLSYSFDRLKDAARANNTPLDIQVKELERLVEQAVDTIKRKTEANNE